MNIKIQMIPLLPPILSPKHGPIQSPLPPFRFGNDTIIRFCQKHRCHFLTALYVYASSLINSVCKSALYYLRNISRMREFLSLKTTEILVHAFVSQAWLLQLCFV